MDITFLHEAVHDSCLLHECHCNSLYVKLDWFISDEPKPQESFYHFPWPKSTLTIFRGRTGWPLIYTGWKLFQTPSGSECITERSELCPSIKYSLQVKCAFSCEFMQAEFI